MTSDLEDNAASEHCLIHAAFVFLPGRIGLMLWDLFHFIKLYISEMWSWLCCGKETIMMNETAITFNKMEQ